MQTQDSPQSSWPELRVSASPSPASNSRAARLTWSRQPRRRPAGLPDPPLANPSPVPHSLFPLFYLVEIRHRQLLQSQLHPFTGADPQEITMRIWRLHDYLFVKLRREQRATGELRESYWDASYWDARFYPPRRDY